MCDANDKMLMATCMSSWIAVYAKFCRERSVHDKFRKQLRDAEQRLIDYKLYQKGNVHGVMNRKNMASADDLKRQVIRLWVEEVAFIKEDRLLGGSIREQQEKLAAMNAMHKENAQK